MFKLFLIGVSAYGLSSEQARVLARCRLIVASDRHMNLVSGMEAEKLGITPLSQALEKVRQQLKTSDVAVLASGDPMFFGIGRRLLDAIGSEAVEIFPGLSAMQEAFARFKMPWDDAAFISLHGREFFHLPGLLLRQQKTFVFTDKKNSPDRLARLLIVYLEGVGAQEILDGCKVQVAENIGAQDERLITGSLQEIAGQSFADLNVVIFTRPEIMASLPGGFGLTEDEISHHRGLITKDEIRAVTLHKLRLPRVGVFWDIGAGSGSVSLEAARLNPEMVVYAIERRLEEVANVKENIRKHSCFNVMPVQGEAPAALQELPDPNTVFIGGSGGRLPEIVSVLAKRLPLGGRVVINGVTEKTVAEAPRLLAQHGFAVEMGKIQVERTTFAEAGGATKVFNPITVMVGRK